jgi:antitoxin component HigA of HigAB toxin-antitoxin module
VQAVSDNEYRAALAEIRQLVEHEPDHGTPEGNRLDALSMAAEAYELGASVLGLADTEAR